MHTIQPCCAKKNWLAVRDAIGNNGITLVRGEGDMSIAELLPALLTRYGETRMIIQAPSLPDQAAEVVRRWMKRQWARQDGKGKMDVIRELTVVAALDEESSPMASRWLKDNPFGRRLRLVDRQVRDTALLMPDLAILGPLNMRYDRPFVLTVTTRPQQVNDLWEMLTPATPVSAEDPSGSESGT